MMTTSTGARASWSSAATAIRAWETARRGVRVSAAMLEPALELTGIRMSLVSDRAYSLPDLGIADAPVWSDAMVRLSEARRVYYRECLRRDPRALTDAPKVTISTVHGAKGGEATSVGVLTDVTPRVAEGARRAPDAEHRGWYVAATRAREKLVLVRPTTDLGYAV
jgi:superfamily I DNA/RNA helicase